MSKLFILAGTKGGIGKSLLATLIADMAYDNKFRPVLFDCDEENRTLSNAFGENDRDVIIHKVDMIEHGRRVFPLDAVVDQVVRIERDKQQYPGDNAFILDMKAGTTAGTMEWLRDFPFSDLRRFGIDANIIGIVTAELDSCSTLLPWLHAYLMADMLSLVRFVVVKNQFAGSDFQFFDGKIREILSLANVPCMVLNLIDWGSKHQFLIQTNHTSYGKIATGRSRIKEFGFMDEYRIKRRYAETCQEFSRLFEREPEPKEKTGGKTRGDK